MDVEVAIGVCLGLCVAAEVLVAVVFHRTLSELKEMLTEIANMQKLS